MKFLGSKNKISKHIAPILQNCLDNNNAVGYYEPFFGGGNMMDKITHKRRMGSDIHKELIEMWYYLLDAHDHPHDYNIPTHITEQEYRQVKDYRDNISKNQFVTTHIPDWYIAFVGFHASFGARYFEGYARSFKADGVTPRDMSGEAIRNTMKQLPKLKGVELHTGCYSEANPLMTNFVIYCDPPYSGTKEYEHKKFDYNHFWKWVKFMSLNNWVFVSEYSAPPEFKCVWEMEITTKINNVKHDKKIEKLFIYEKAKGATKKGS